MITDIKKWADRLPKGERDMPLIILKERMFSPNQTISELDAKTPVATELQTEIERLDVTEVSELLAVTRIRRRLEQRPLDEPYVYFVGEDALKSHYTARDIIEAIEERTAKGKSFIEDEKRYIQYLYGLGG